MFKVLPHDLKPLSWWHDQYQEGRLEMRPPYQRRSGIWSHWKQAHLIDSVINDFDIPKFYVADFTRFPNSKLNTTKKPYAVIDGKQRLQALFDFLDGHFSLNNSATFADDERANVGGLSFSDLKAHFPAAARKVMAFTPAVMDVITDEEDKLEEMFVRLNSGEHTTGAEKRNAMPGPIPAIIRELSVHPFFMRKIRFTKKRMQDLNLVAKLLLIEMRGRFVDTKAKNLDDLVKATARDFRAAKTDDERNALSEQHIVSQSAVFDVLEKMSSVFVDNDPLLANQGSIPLFYWLVRNERPRGLRHVRDFLMQFTAAIRENLAVQRDDPEAGDQTLSHYYTMSRTTNDQQSLSGRYEILRTKFHAYLRHVAN